MMHTLFGFFFYAERTSHSSTISAQEISVYGSKLLFISKTRILKLIPNSCCTINAEEEKKTKHYKAKPSLLKVEKRCFSVS